jgi:hypothetical protein
MLGSSTPAVVRDLAGGVGLNMGAATDDHRVLCGQTMWWPLIPA